MASMPTPRTLLDTPQAVITRLRTDVDRGIGRTRNAIKVLAGHRPRTAASPKDVVWSHGRSRMWRYRSDKVTLGPPLLIVFSLVSKSRILDLTPGNSFIERLVDAGFDVFMIDWGVPDERDADNRLEDYVDGYIPAAVGKIREMTGSPDINLLGYCFGGDLSLLYAAHHPDAPLRSLTVMATPVDFRHLGPMTDGFRLGGLDIEDFIGDDGNVPAHTVRQGLRVLTPTSEVSRYVNLLDKLWNDDYLASYQTMTGWSDDHIPFPGAAARETVKMLVHDNGMINDELYVGDDRVHLSDIKVPFFTVRATRDHVVPEKAAAPLIDLVGSEDKTELALDAGHIGLVVGKTAHKTTIPTILEFLTRKSSVLA